MDALSAERGGQTRRQILAAAFALFSRQGYHATAMRQVAQEAGVALGGIYNHFASKEELFVQVLLEHHPVYEILPDLQAAQGDSLRQLIADAAYRLTQRFEERLDFLNLMFIELVEFEGRHLDELFARIYPHTQAFAQRLLTWQEELRPIPFPLLLRALIGLFFSYVITERMIGSRMPAEMRQGALEAFVEIFLYGITKRSPDELTSDLDHP